MTSYDASNCVKPRMFFVAEGKLCSHFSAVARGGAGGARAPPVFFIDFHFLEGKESVSRCS